MKFWKTVVLLGATAVLSACGSNTADSVVKSISIANVEDPVTHHTMVEMTAEIDSANMIFPIAYIPIMDPKNPSVQIATIRMENTLDNRNMLYISADASLFKVGDHQIDPKLPNGNPLPISGLTKIWGVQDTKTKTRVYVAEYQGKLVVGAAIAIKEFDGLAQTMPGANLFFRFPNTSGVTGVAGFFTGTQPSTSGVGIFAQTDWVTPIGDIGSLAKAAAPAGDVNFKTNKPSATQAWKMQYFFWDLNRRGSQLHLAK